MRYNEFPDQCILTLISFPPLCRLIEVAMSGWSAVNVGSDVGMCMDFSAIFKRQDMIMMALCRSARNVVGSAVLYLSPQVIQ